MLRLGRAAIIRRIAEHQVKGADRTVGSRGFKRQNISLAKLPLYHWFADMPGGASIHTRLPRLASPLR